MKYIRLLRIKHYIKNIIIFLPVFFAKELSAADKILILCSGYASFCFLSSAVYILNDLMDAEKDRLHPVKRLRPLASGEVTKAQAVWLFSACLILSFVFHINTGHLKGAAVLALFFIMNVLYSTGMKKIAILDVLCLALGYVLRVQYGGILSDSEISGWFYMVVLSGAFYLGLGKRREEIKMAGGIDTREVLKYYTYAFLDKNMYVFMELTIVFYSFWAVSQPGKMMRWTIPVFMLILMKYSLDVEDEKIGGADPVEVILKDKMLMVILAVYGILAAASLYF